MNTKSPASNAPAKPAQTPTISMLGSEHLWEWLNQAEISLSFTTYQTNRLFTVGCKASGRLAINERLFDKPMGLYVDDDRLIMSTRYQIWELENRLAPQETHHQHDQLYFPSKSYTTGDLNVHDVVADSDRNILFVNTDFSCLATIQPGYSFAPIWTPPFISKLVAEDKCHLNGLAMVEGQPTYVTACSSTDDAAGWRNHRVDGGVVMHIPSNQIVTTGLSMPHSPRWYQGKLWLLNAGSGELGYLDGDQFIPIAFCPGFLRGLAFHEHLAIVGLSKLRSKTFGGLPLETRLAAEGNTSHCGLMVIDLRTGKVVHWLHINGVVEELFDVVVLPGMRQPQVIGFQGEEIERLVNFPNSGGLVTTKPTVKRPSMGFVPVAGLPREEQGTAVNRPQQSRSAAKNSVVKYQRVYHLTPANLAPYDAMTFPSLQQRWQTQPQQGEIVAVSAAVEGEMVGFTVAEILPDRTVELLSLFVAPEYRRGGIGTRLVRQLRADLTIQLGTEVNLLDRQNPHPQPPQQPAQDIFLQGKQQYRQGNYSGAQACFDMAIQLQPDFIPAYNSLGNLFQVRGEIAKAIDIYQQALALDDQVAAIHCNLASLHQLQGDHQRAITGYQRSIDLDPNFWLAHYNLGKLFAAQSQFPAAIDAYQSALKINPTAAEIESDLGHIYRQQGATQAAIDCYRRAIIAQPQSAPAYNHFGSIMFEQGNLQLAEAAYRDAIKRSPDYDLPHANLAFLLAQADRLVEAKLYSTRALSLKSTDDLNVLYFDNYLQLQLADWKNYDQNLADLIDRTTTSVDQSSVNSAWLLTAFPLPPDLQTKVARQQAQKHIRGAKFIQSQFTRLPVDRASTRLRIGYVSPDFNSHPVGTLIHQMFQYHQRPDFEIFAYSLSPVVDDFTENIRQGCDHFLNVFDRSSLEIAQQIQADGIHILIDLAGYTTNSRTQIFALQPAPIQVQYLGYPGTMGADFIQYILADRHLIPPELTQYYTESPIYLDRAWVASPMEILPSDLTRTDWGLPAIGTVFCCFNNTYKIDPKVFQSWMHILQQVPNSVLWLADRGIPIIIDRLRQQSADLGIDPQRLIFSPNLPHAEYLARYQCADIFLDTFTYNAGATAIGALSAGLPILTCPGETYVSRMCASICHGAGLSELVCDTPSSYERLAIDIGNHPSQIHALKAKVAATMTTSPFFQPQLFIRNLERELHQIWQIYLNKSDPASLPL